MRKTLVATAVILSTIPLLALPAAAGEAGESNIRFTVTVVDTAPGGQVSRRSTEILAPDGTRGDVSAGWKVPIPTASTSTEGGEEMVTAYSYQDVGFLARIDGRIEGASRVHATGRIEVSAVESGDASTPTIASFSQRFDVFVGDGDEVTLARAPRPDGGSVSLQLAAEIQR